MQNAEAWLALLMFVLEKSASTAVMTLMTPGNSTAQLQVAYLVLLTSTPALAQLLAIGPVALAMNNGSQPGF